jgi:hypothetical protein
MRDSGCDYQDVVTERRVLMVFIASVDKLGVFIDPADFAKKYGRVSLIFQKSPDRRRDLSGRKHRCRHLIQQGLKEIVIRSINHQDIGVRMPKGLSGSEPRKTGTDNHDSLHLFPHFVIRSRILVEM